MIHLDARTRIIATALAALAGYVDAMGFLGSGGFFVSFMSGNSTRLAVGLVERWSFALTAAQLVGAFIMGVVTAALIAGRRPRNQQRTTMQLVSIALALAAATAEVGPPLAALALVAFAMGAENIVFERDGDVRIGLTYMTGTLVKTGQRLAVALNGGERWGWLPFLRLWLGLIFGAVAGAMSFGAFGMRGLWVAAAVSAVLSLITGQTTQGGEPQRK